MMNFEKWAASTGGGWGSLRIILGLALAPGFTFIDILPRLSLLTNEKFKLSISVINQMTSQKWNFTLTGQGSCRKLSTPT
jgi:hypothetical protein